MKKSDKKQYEKAWDCFNSGCVAFMKSLLLMKELKEEDFTIDNLNQMGGRLTKVATTISRIYEEKKGE